MIKFQVQQIINYILLGNSYTHYYFHYYFKYIAYLLELFNTNQIILLKECFLN